MVVHVFRTDDTDLLASSLDKTGADIPPRDYRFVGILCDALPDFRVLPQTKAPDILVELGFHLVGPRS